MVYVISLASSKFGQRLLVKKSKLGDLSQSERQHILNKSKNFQVTVSGMVSSGKEVLVFFEV